MKMNLHKQYFYNGNRNELIKAFETIRNNSNIKVHSFTVTEIAHDTFRITSDFSFGTAIGTGGALTKGISVFCKISDSPPRGLKVDVKTKLRLEFYFTLIIACFFYVVMLLSDQTIPFWVYLFPVIPIPWFQMIYRVQEKSLIKRFAKTFNLKEITSHPTH